MSDIKTILKCAALVCEYRSGDIDTEDGTFSATDTDCMIRLESSLANMFNDNSDDSDLEEMWPNIEKYCERIESLEAAVKELTAKNESLEAKVKNGRSIARIVALKICGSCNKEFQLEMGYFGNSRGELDAVINIQNCTRCGVRNDPWLKLTTKHGE